MNNRLHRLVILTPLKQVISSGETCACYDEDDDTDDDK